MGGCAYHLDHRQIAEFACPSTLDFIRFRRGAPRTQT
jgi:hypothetical protein